MTATEAQRRYRLILAHLVVKDRPRSPNEVGYAVAAHMPVAQPFDRGAAVRRQGPGTTLAPSLRALERRGLVRSTQRPDGLTGVAYEITASGRKALAGDGPL